MTLWAIPSSSDTSSWVWWYHWKQKEVYGADAKWHERYEWYDNGQRSTLFVQRGKSGSGRKLRKCAHGSSTTEKNIQREIKVSEADEERGRGQWTKSGRGEFCRQECEGDESTFQNFQGA
ncbi:hypothetical protein CDAR_172021 [Caerostris darwini]|uniref:Uncharacterized protein n=1 Tax=Caerostris darwini TaxID=1538125 RepID=A0AAV4U906_9ARAC|nr:hypothetical protein CDAR_172021 [Caerostris darwini]